MAFLISDADMVFLMVWDCSGGTVLPTEFGGNLDGRPTGYMKAPSTCQASSLHSVLQFGSLKEMQRDYFRI